MVVCAVVLVVCLCGDVLVACLSRRWEHLHARALQIRAELSTHIYRETGSQRPTHSFWSFRVDAHRNPVGESVCLSVGVCEGGGVRPPPRERVSRAVAEGCRAECVCEAESELESVVCVTCFSSHRWRKSARKRSSSTPASVLGPASKANSSGVSRDYILHAHVQDR